MVATDLKKMDEKQEVTKRIKVIFSEKVKQQKQGKINNKQIKLNVYTRI